MSIADKGWKSSRGLRRTAHQSAALGDVGTVADFFVLRPLAEQRGLATWEQLAADAAEATGRVRGDRGRASLRDARGFVERTGA